MIRVEMRDHQVVLDFPEMILALSKAQFVEALAKGKGLKRAEAMAQRLHTEERPHAGR